MLPNLQPGELIFVMVVAVLLFGKKLPEVGRSLGKGLIEFKKGLRGVEDEFDISGPPTSSSRTDLSRVTDDAGMISVPKFEPPTSPPIAQPATSGTGANLHTD